MYAMVLNTVEMDDVFWIIIAKEILVCLNFHHKGAFMLSFRLNCPFNFAIKGILNNILLTGNI